MKYICTVDECTYSEEGAHERVWELIEEEDLEEATKALFNFRDIFKALPTGMKEVIFEEAYNLVMENFFFEIKEEEEE